MSCCSSTLVERSLAIKLCMVDLSSCSPWRLVCSSTRSRLLSFSNWLRLLSARRLKRKRTTMKSPRVTFRPQLFKTWIKCYPLDKSLSKGQRNWFYIRWIVIYPVSSPIQLWNNEGQVCWSVCQFILWYPLWRLDFPVRLVSIVVWTLNKLARVYVKLNYSIFRNSYRLWREVTVKGRIFKQFILGLGVEMGQLKALK